MTQGALNVLDENSLGFFLMVEGGAVDWANHANQMGRMIEEQTDFNNAVATAITWIEANSHWNETLLIVTGDHECGYLWGPGSGSPNTFNEIIDNGAGNLPGGWYYSGNHSNSLIPFYAKGASSVWFDTFADELDSVCDRYIDNIEIAEVIFGYYDEILPVGLSSFDVTIGDGYVTVNWTTTSEEDNDRFEVERDGIIVASVPATNAATGNTYQWIDSNIRRGDTYTYTLHAVDINGNREKLAHQTVTVGFSQLTIASDYILYPNYPNPFNATTTIRYDVKEPNRIQLTIFNQLGQKVAMLADGNHTAGSYSVSWNATGLPSGIYLCRMETPDFVQTRKLMLVK